MKGSRNSTLTNSEKALSIAVNLYALVVFVVLWLLEWIFPALPWMTLYLYPEWDKYPDGQRNQAGPARNQRVMTELREIMRENNQTACHIFFNNTEKYDFDRAVSSMYNTATAMNKQLERRPATAKYVVPIIDAEGWMEYDLDSAAAKSLLVPGEESDFVDTVNVGANRLQPRTGNIVSTVLR